MTKIDKRINYRMVLDTETCPLDRDLQGVVPFNMFAYDIGWAIVDKRGKVYKTESFVIADIFLDEKALMKSAYYADKIPQYWEDIKNGKRKLKTFYNIYKAFLDDITMYNIKEFYAHNMYFDYHVLNNTYRWITKSRYRYFFPYEADICDTLKMARQAMGNNYKKFCLENGYMTKHKTPRARYTAEILYRYISKNNDFVEHHTGLEDVLIEKEIMAYCFGKHKKMDRYFKRFSKPIDNPFIK